VQASLALCHDHSSCRDRRLRTHHRAEGIVDGGDADGCKALRQWVPVVDNVVGAVGLAVLNGLSAGGGGDDGEAEDVLGDLGCDGPDAASAADDQDRLAGAAAGRDAHRFYHRLPGCRRARMQAGGQ